MKLFIERRTAMLAAVEMTDSIKAGVAELRRQKRGEAKRRLRSLLFSQAGYREMFLREAEVAA